MPNPSTSRWEAIASGFDRKANFSHCIGAVDRKHIRIIKPEHSGSVYLNYKYYFFIVLFEAADSISLCGYWRDRQGLRLDYIQRNLILEIIRYELFLVQNL
jgi:hypothetical protein